MINKKTNITLLLTLGLILGANLNINCMMTFDEECDVRLAAPNNVLVDDIEDNLLMWPQAFEVGTKYDQDRYRLGIVKGLEELEKRCVKDASLEKERGRLQEEFEDWDKRLAPGGSVNIFAAMSKTTLGLEKPKSKFVLGSELGGNRLLEEKSNLTGQFALGKIDESTFIKKRMALMGDGGEIFKCRLRLKELDAKRVADMEYNDSVVASEGDFSAMEDGWCCIDLTPVYAEQEALRAKIRKLKKRTRLK